MKEVQNYWNEMIRELEERRRKIIISFSKLSLLLSVMEHRVGGPTTK